MKTIRNILATIVLVPFGIIIGVIAGILFMPAAIVSYIVHDVWSY